MTMLMFHNHGGGSLCYLRSICTTNGSGEAPIPTSEQEHSEKTPRRMTMNATNAAGPSYAKLPAKPMKNACTASCKDHNPTFLKRRNLVWSSDTSLAIAVYVWWKALLAQRLV